MIKKVALIGLILLGVAAAVPLYEYYNIRYHRPIEIQREFLGRVIARGNQLVGFDWSMTGYGDAVFRWSYRVENADALRRSCRTIDQGNCILGGRADNDTSLSIFVRGDAVTIEEWWY